MDVFTLIGSIAGLIALGVNAFLAHLILRTDNSLLKVEAKWTAAVEQLRDEVQRLMIEEKERREVIINRMLEKIEANYVRSREAFLAEKIHIEEIALLKRINENHHSRINTMERQIAELIYSRNPPRP